MEINENEPTQTGAFASESSAANKLVIPVVQENILLNKKKIQTGSVRIEKKVHEENVIVNVPLVHDEIDIKTVPVNQFTDTPPEALRYEGDTMIISVLKEVSVIRILVEKEIHITRRKINTAVSETILLRKEEVTVENNHGKDTVVSVPPANL